MKIAYVFVNDMAATYKLSSMILPQLEADSHIVQVVGMFFFDDNVFSLRKGDPARPLRRLSVPPSSPHLAQSNILSSRSAW